MTGERFENGQTVIENWDAVFRACAAEPRRQLIVSLLDVAPAEPVALPEHAMSPTVPREFDCLRIELQHTHLPLLNRLGFVEWRTDPFEATQGPRYEHVRSVFETFHRNVADLPGSLVTGCRRLEHERETRR